VTEGLSCWRIAQFGKVRRILDAESFDVTGGSVHLCPDNSLTRALIGVFLRLDFSVFPSLAALGRGKIVEERLTGSINSGESF
jgi:hypothetical protein